MGDPERTAEMKACTNPECHLGDQLQDMDKFGNKADTKDLKKSRCKVCLYAADKIRRGTVEERAKKSERDRIRRLDPVNQARKAEYDAVYQKTAAGKAVQKRSKAKRRLVSPERTTAGRRLGYAIEKGRLTRPDVCSLCGKHKSGVGTIQAHHHDYSDPLNVRWLCSACHKHWHRYHTYQGSELQTFALKPRYVDDPPEGMVEWLLHYETSEAAT